MRRARELRERQRETGLDRRRSTVVDRLRLFLNRPLRDGDRPRLFAIAVAVIIAAAARSRSLDGADHRRRPARARAAAPTRSPTTSARHGGSRAAPPRPLEAPPSEEGNPPAARDGSRADVARRQARRPALPGRLPALHLRPRTARDSHPRRHRRAAAPSSRASARACPPASAAGTPARRAAAERRGQRTGPRRSLALVDDGERRYTRRARARPHARAAGWSPASGADAAWPPRLSSPAPRSSAAVASRRGSLGARWSCSALLLVLVIGVLGAIFGLQPLPGRLRALARSRRAEIPPQYLRALPAGRPALRHRPVDPRRDRRDRDRPRPLHRARACTPASTRYGCCAGPMQFSRHRHRPAPGTATASTATTTAASPPTTRPTRSPPPPATCCATAPRPTTTARSSRTTTPTGTSPRCSPRPTEYRARRHGADARRPRRHRRPAGAPSRDPRQPADRAHADPARRRALRRARPAAARRAGLDRRAPRASSSPRCKSDHSTYTVDGTISNHSAGRAMDIGAVDGEICRGTRTGRCADLVRQLAADHRPIALDRAASTAGTPTGRIDPRGFARADHCDHIHWGMDG